MSEDADLTPGLNRPNLLRALESAARLQAVILDAVLVGGSARTIRQLGGYTGLDARWTAWQNVTGACRSLAAEMTL